MHTTPSELAWPSARTASNQNPQDRRGPHLHAQTEGTIPPPDRSTGRATDRSAAFEPTNSLLPPIVGLPDLSLRVSSLVTAAVLLRTVGYDQMRRLLYPERNASAVRKDVREAVDNGWLHRWSYPIARYGRVGYVHPTARANEIVLQALRVAVKGSAWESVVMLMLPTTPRPALDLANVPKWFAHQREVNHLVTSIVCHRAPLWASAWNEPFPPTVNGRTMPQPDYVVVEEIRGEPVIVFGEHDRGHEPVERFIARKVALYTTLAGVSEPLLGARSFRVDVSVLDAVSRHPIERLTKLHAATRAYGASHMFQFTLGGWLHADVRRVPWFRQTPPSSDSVRMADHAPEA